MILDSIVFIFKLFIRLYKLNMHRGKDVFMLVLIVVMSSALVYTFYATKVIEAKQNVLFNMHDPRMVRQDELEV